MSPTDHPALLATQLLAVLDELADGHGDLREAACLAGQLERLNPSAAALQTARQRIDHAPPELLVGEPFDVQALAGDVLAADDPDAMADALLALDEACAGASFLGLTRAVRRAVRGVVAEIKAEPEAWSAQVPLARSVLARCAPVAGDPAADLWDAIAACPVQEEGGWGSVPLDGPSLLDLLPPPAAKARPEPAPARSRPTPVLPGTPAATPRRGLSVRRSGDEVS
jgi:hypothetical protein